MLGLQKNINTHFYRIKKAYCFMKTQRVAEAQDIIAEFKVNRPSEPVLAKYLVHVYNDLAQYDQTTALLEYVVKVHMDHEEMQEELFFAYVRENKLLKQQNQALQLYKQFQRDVHALWAVESMYLISLNLKFETKILDIAYLLMLKLMKEPLFTLDKKFILLYVKVLSKQGKFREALDFIELKSEFFADKLERQAIEADLYMKSKNPVLTINVYFNMLRLNSHLNHY